MLNTFKGFYQHMEARLPQIWCDGCYSYSKKEAIRIARSNVAGRVGCGSQDINFLLVIPIVNWETILVDQFSRMGTCHHCDIVSTGFFDSVGLWEAHKLVNTLKIKSFFEENYDESKLNLVFMYLSEFHFDTNIVGKIKRKNTLIVNFNWDDILHYKRIHNGQSAGLAGLAKVVDFNLTMSVSPLTRYVRDGASVFYWDGIDNAEAFTPDIVPAKVNRVLFFGSRYGYRGPLIAYLMKKNVPIDVYGKGWGTDFIEYNELHKKIRSYALNLGISTIAYTRNLCCFKGRDLEVPLHGGLYLVNDHPEITNVYEPNVDVLVYQNKSDCYEKICSVLENPENYHEVKTAGARKAASLSWNSRCKYLLSIIKMVVD
jgi:hypothetical protein